MSASLLERALDAGEGLLRLTPTWVPRSFLHPGKRIKLHPERLLRLRRQPRRHRRALVRHHHRGGQREPHARRGAQLRRRSNGKRFTLRDAVAEAGDRLIGEAMFEQVQALAGLLEVLRQHGADPAPHAPERQAGGARRPGRQAGELLLPAAAQQRRQQLPLHVHGPGAGHDEGPDSASCLENWNKGDNGILDLSQGVPPASPAPAG